MCNLSKGVEEIGIKKGISQGISRGITQGVLISIQNLMASTGWSIEQAMDALKIPEAERTQYANELNKN